MPQSAVKDVIELPTKNNKMDFREILNNMTPNAGTDLLRYARTKEGIVSLAQGEGCIPTPDFICDAAVKAMKEEHKTFYAPPLGHPEMRQGLSDYYKRIYGYDIPASRLFLTGSATTAIHLCLATLLTKGDEIVAVTPIWKNLLSAVEIAEAKIHQVGLDHDDQTGWHLDLDKLFGACTHKTKAIMIVSPSNPTGWMMTPEDIQAVLEFARSRGIWVIADEVYSRLVFGETRAPSFLDYAHEKDRLLVVNSFSKTWAMTGWRLGWIVGPEEAERPICDLALYNSMGPSSFLQYGALAALEQGEDFIDLQMTLWESNRDIIMDRFSKMPTITMTKPDATFYAFFKVDNEPDDVAFCRHLIDDVGLSLAPGSAFGNCCEGFIRMSFACSQEKLLDALDRLERGLR